MDIENANKLFDDFILRMNAIEPVGESLRIKLEIAFKEGIIKGQEAVLERFNQIKI